jgi:peptidoglycan/xylan/chitin deacetylase (PgdA/CDA1 family)
MRDQIKKTPYWLAIAVALFLFFEAWLQPSGLQTAAGAPSASRISVFVNDRTVSLDGPATVARALESAGFSARAGDLLDLDGKVFRSGGGWAPKLFLNGRKAPISAPVKASDRINIIPAFNRSEQVRMEVRDVVLADEVDGAGEYVVVKDMGIVGKKLIARGRASGKIVSARNLVEARPFRMERTAEKPEKIIALTFDDGPTPPYTGEVVRILKESRATATFFVIGRQAALFPESVRQVKAAGFLIGNHTYSHKRLDRLGEESIIRELDATSDTVVPLINEPLRWLRPPYGAVSQALREIAGARGYNITRWNIDSRDWTGVGAEEIANGVIGAAQPGAIVLMHDGGGDRTNTIQALPIIIRTLYERGYSFVTLDQLIK